MVGLATGIAVAGLLALGAILIALYVCLKLRRNKATELAAVPVVTETTHAAGDTGEQVVRDV